MKKIILAIVLALLGGMAVAAGSMSKTPDGLISIKSKHSVKVTIDRLQAILKKKGFGIAVRWSHHQKAASVGMKLRPTELLLFGKPAAGTHFFTSKQTAGIDLPMKALAWQDDKGQVWLSYNDPAWIAARHGIKDRAKIVAKMRGALKKLTSKAAN